MSGRKRTDPKLECRNEDSEVLFRWKAGRPATPKLIDAINSQGFCCVIAGPKAWGILAACRAKIKFHLILDTKAPPWLIVGTTKDLRYIPDPFFQRKIAMRKLRWYVKSLINWRCKRNGN